MKMNQKLAVVQQLEQKRSRRFYLIAVGLALFLLLLLLAAGFFYFQSERVAYEEEIADHLKSSALAKIETIGYWREERGYDAQFLAQLESIQHVLLGYHQQPTHSDDLQQAQYAISDAGNIYDYDNIQLVDINKKIVYQYNTIRNELTKPNLELLDKAFRTGQTQISDIAASTDGKNLYILFISPIIRPGGQVLGAIVLVVNPQKYLYPKLSQRADHFNSIESFLIKNSNGSAIAVSPLAAGNISVLSILARADKTDRPGIKAFNGAVGFVSGPDYLNVPVLADVRPVPDTNWFLITKGNTSDLMREFYQRMWIIGTSVLLILSVVIGFGMFLFTNSRRSFYKKLYFAESQAAKAQRELSSAVNAIKEGFITTDPVGKVTGLNPMAQALLGTSEEAALGLTLAEVLTLKDGPNILQQSAANADGLVSLESELITSSGAATPVQLTLSPVKQGDDSLVGYVLVLRDLTETVLARQQILSSNQKYTTLFENSPEAIVILSMPTATITQVNQAFIQLTQYQLKDVFGKTTFEIKLWADPEKEIAYRKETSNATSFNNYETQIRIRDGSIKQVNTSAKRLTMNDEDIWLIVIRDVSELRAAAERGRQRDLLVNTIFETSPICIWARDLTGKLIVENRVSIQIYGSHVGERLQVSDNPKLPILNWIEMNKAVYQGQTITFEEEEPTLNGEISYVQKIITPMIQDGKIEGIMGFVIDVTDRRRAEMELQKEREELKRSNAELEQFAYVASHDLQEPLRMVTSYLQLIERRYKDKFDEKGLDFINFAVEGASNMQRLILDLLMYSRVGTHGQETTPCDSQNALNLALNNLRFRVEETNAIITHGDLPTVLADEKQLTQLFQNLVGNAIKFVQGRNPKIHIECVAKDDFWHFTVKDNGIGIDKRFAERIFIIFHRLNEKTDYAGTGIGLAICKKIVDRHGGKIWVESEVGLGSTFHFTLARKAQNTYD